MGRTAPGGGSVALKSKTGTQISGELKMDAEAVFKAPAFAMEIRDMMPGINYRILDANGKQVVIDRHEAKKSEERQRFLEVEPDAIFQTRRARIEVRVIGDNVENLKSGVYFRYIKADGAVILAEPEKGKLLLQQDYRFMVGQDRWEFVIEGIKAGERARQAAVRGLREEIGVKAAKLTFLQDVNTDPGTSTVVDYYYLARNLRFIGGVEEENEKIKNLTEFRIQDLLRMVRRNELHQNETVSGILYYATFRKEL